MTTLSERTPIQIGLVFLLATMVGGLAYQQGVISGKSPQEGQFLRTDVFNTWAVGFNDTMELRFAPIEKMERRLDNLEITAAGMKIEIARMSVALEGKKNVEPGK